MPPRHGKSTTCSAWLPYWFLNLWPHKSVMLASYGATFAERWGRRVRRLSSVHSGACLFDIASDSRSAGEWETTEGGGMKCVGVGGDATGRGADLLVCDDLVKNSEEARSQVMRDKTWEFWQETLRTRMEPGASCVCVMTRWHEDDFGGRLLASDDRDFPLWEHIDFPAIALSEDVLGRREGDALWPERYPVESLLALRDSAAGIGSRAFESLYQQRPTPAEGFVFRMDDLRYWSRSPEGGVCLHGSAGDEVVQPPAMSRFQIVDTAMKDGKENDWTVVGTFGVTRKRQLVVLDIDRRRVQVPDQLPMVREARRKWSPSWIGVEDKGSGTGIIQEARRQGLMLRPLKADRDKVTRAAPAAALCEQGGVFLHRDAHWLGAFVSELMSFPNGKNDDQVDVLAHAVVSLTVPAPMPTRREERPNGLGMAEGGFTW